VQEHIFVIDWQRRSAETSYRKNYSRRIPPQDRRTNGYLGTITCSTTSPAMLHVIWYIIIGFIAGLIAKLIMHVHMGLLATILLGIVGSIVGGLIARIFSKPADGAPFHPAGFILSIIGAIVVLFILQRFFP
jgi:uncharacterized membrane protein YeaQ/YmgE (transglycosylase-associated protein family)